MRKDFRIIACISGRGSNLAAILGTSTPFKVVSVISDRATAPGLSIAQAAGVETKIFKTKDFTSKSAAQQSMTKYIHEKSVDLVVLAGFMQILLPEFIEEFPARIINIHPSLLPKFPGLNTHARALDAKEKHHGCTVHVVDAGIDTGPLIAQASCLTESADSPETLAERVLEKEHALYPWVIKKIAQQEILLSPNKIQATAIAVGEAEAMGFILPKYENLYSA